MKMKIFKFSSLFLLLAVTGLGEFQEISGSCNKNSDCATKNAICIDGQCTCDNISYNGTGCLPYVTMYKEYCEEQKQCEWLGHNSDCIENHCICRENYLWYQGSCQPSAEKGTSCKSNTDCNSPHDILSLQCDSDKSSCVCADDYYDRKYDCRKKSSEGNACALDIDCQSPTLTCTLGICSVIKQTVEQSSYNFEYSPSGLTKPIKITNGLANITCTFDNDCQDIANSFCDPASGTCSCDKNTQYIYKGNCLPGLGSCQEAMDCGSWKNSICFKNTCVCSQGFFLHEGKCIAELGMPDPSLKSDKDCVVKPGQLVKRGKDSACFCKNYWSNDDTNRKCIKTMIQDVSSCLSNEWCEAMGPYSYCDSKTEKCRCSSFATLDKSSYYCVKKDDAKGGCLRDSNCKLNEECIDEKCQCIQNYSRYGSVCLPDIGGSCDNKFCSHIANSGCSQGVCQCFPAYIGLNKGCFKAVENLNEECEINEQCQHIKFSQCGSGDGENKTCICRNGYTEINNHCLQSKEYGDPCMKTTDCTLVLNHSFECRNSQCQCPMGSKLNDGYCTSSSTKYSLAVSLLLLCAINLFLNIQ
ncbi:unnamed protein product [Phaedon cochleariae]|uniref:EGF-like domain-containing protein n=1 Tax=Phaedon cochleariae TaxID=80249 RepID=A0A9P0DKM5_PHACE|nr:unnamed protein product [Phaedon cochleariae]